MIRFEEDRRESLRTQYAHLSSEYRFLKEHQWKIAYYALLLDAAIVGLFQLDVIEMSKPVHFIARLLSLGGLGVALGFMHSNLSHTANSIKKTRNTIRGIENELGISTQTSKEKTTQDKDTASDPG